MINIKNRILLVLGLIMALSVFVSKYHDGAGIIIDGFRLRRVSIALLFLFVVVFLFQLYGIIISVI